MRYASEKERLESKIIPRFRAEETACIVVFENQCKCPDLLNFWKVVQEVTIRLRPIQF